MDEVRWAFNRINWTLYRDDAGRWTAFSSASENHNTMDKKSMESWLTDRGLRTGDIKKLFRDVEKMVKRRSPFHACTNLATNRSPSGSASCLMQPEIGLAPLK